MSFDPALPRPYSMDWREAYLYDKEDTPRLSAYQAPGKDPVPFVMDNIRLSGGQAVDTAEYPFDGKWSSTPLNEKPHSITINGFIRGQSYIRNRNNLVEALRITTDDTDTGIIDLPLWGRFPVVVVDYNVEEKGKENGQCSVSMTFTRAGVTLEERWKFLRGGYGGPPELPAKFLEEAAVESFVNALEGNVDHNSLASGFVELMKLLIGIVGRIQGAMSLLNHITNKITNITNLIAQGINAPRALAQALFGAVASIVTGVLEIKNAWNDMVSFFKDPWSNYKRLLSQFLGADKIDTKTETTTTKQYTTKAEVENLFRTAALCAAGQILAQMEMTYEEAKSYWALYEELEASVNQNDPEVYRAIRDMRLAVSSALVSMQLDNELTRTIAHPVPLLYLAQTLACDSEKLRRFNVVDDSFVVRGEVKYV